MKRLLISVATEICDRTSSKARGEKDIVVGGISARL